jgi:hypothetical protein
VPEKIEVVKTLCTSTSSSVKGNEEVSTTPWLARQSRFKSMTIEDSLPDAPNGSLEAFQSTKEAGGRATVHAESVIDDVKLLQRPLSPTAITEAGSDYGDFASDEEEVINHLLENLAPPSPSADPPLVVTDIEDYEEPRGVRLPKVLGVERSLPKWQSLLPIQVQDKIVRNGSSSHCTSHGLVHMAPTLTY